MNETSKILEPNEKVIWSGKPKYLSYVLSSFGGIIFFAIFLGVFLIPFSNSTINGVNNPYLIPLVGFFGVIILTLIFTLLSYSFIEYALTNKRVIVQTGIIGRDFKSIDYDKIQNINVNVGLVGRIFNTGLLRVDGIGFVSISKPYEVMHFLQKQLSSRKEKLYGGKQ